MIRRISAITSIALRTAVRSRIVILLMLPLLFSAIGIPMLVKGDQTIAATVQVMLGYSLAFALAILSIATLWSGCAAISSEVDDKQIHMVVAKPVTRLEVWLGKWFALLILNAVLLLFTGICVYTILHLRTAQIIKAETNPQKQEEMRRTLDEEFLLARRRVPVTFDAAAGMKRLEEVGYRPKDMADSEFEELTWRLYGSAKSGDMTNPFLFRLKKKPAKSHPIFLSYKFQSGGDFSKRNFKGQWTFGDPEKDIAPVDLELEHKVRKRLSLKVPHETVADDNTIQVRYLNNHVALSNLSTNEATTLFFNIRDEMEVRYRSGSFLGNFGKTLLMMFFQLAFLAAIGVTMGSFFSLPVATFSAVAVLMMQQLSGFLETSLSGDGPSVQALEPIYKAIVFLLKPLEGTPVLELLSNGLEITTASLLSSFFFKVVLYGGVFALVGSWVLKRRELGLPS